MDDFTGGLFLIGLGIIGCLTYYIYCIIDRIRFSRQWKNLDIYCKRNGYSRNCVARHETDYIKELSRHEVKELLESYNIDCDLPHDLRFFDNIAVTSIKPYTKRDVISGLGEYIEHRGGERTHRFLTIQWFENGKWMKYAGKKSFLQTEPYIDADFGGMHNRIFKTDSQEEIQAKLYNELRHVIRNFVETDIERWNKENLNNNII